MSNPGGSLFYRPKPRTVEIRRKRWNIWRILWTAIKRTCMTLGAIMLFFIVLTAITSFRVMREAAPTLPKQMVLVFELENGIGEIAQEPTVMDPFPFRRPTIRKIVEALDNAAMDPRVKALVFNVKGGGVSLVHIQEIRAAVKRFRESGKTAYIYSSSYAEFGQTIGLYYLASAFDQIWMQPVGMISFAGIAAEMPFMKETLDKLGINPQFIHREEYKSAMENFTNTTISPPNREQVTSIVTNLAGQILFQTAEDREMDADDLKPFVDKGLLTGREALEAKLIDRLDYGDELVGDIKETLTGNREDETLQLVPLAKYANAQDTYRPFKLHNKGPKHKQIALIYAVGPITATSSFEGAAAAENLSAAFDAAAEDDKIAAIVLRIDSPGGSPSASETIRRAMIRAQDKGKMVVVSMGSVAASGGYWIATEADSIFALPATLTGSIGVIMGKVELTELWKKIGVNWDIMQWGQSADMWSMNHAFDEREMERLNVLIDETYDDFLERVANGRGLPIETVRHIAKGRAWTGLQASESGLVNQLGGLDAALDYTAQQIELPDRTYLDLVILPRPKSAVEQLLELVGRQVQIASVLEKNAKAIEVLEPLLRYFQAAQNPGNYAVYDDRLNYIAPSSR